MEKNRTFTIAFLFVLGIVFAYLPEVLAQDANGAPGLSQILGIRPDMYYSDVNLAATPKGSFNTATLDVPSKLSSIGLKFVKEGDRLELFNLGDGKRSVRYLLTRNEVTYYGSPELAETDLTPPDYRLKKVVGVDLTVGLGRLYGDTTYQIGGRVDSPSGSWVQRFPTSELEFPLYVYMASLGGSVQFVEKWKVSVGLKKNITSDAGTMKDSDWGSNYDEISWWSDPDSLDIYSESDAELDAEIADINLRYKFFKKAGWSLSGGLGYIYQNFEYDIYDLDQWYPSLNEYYGYDIGHDRVSGKVLEYEVTYSIPYMEIGTQFTFKNKFSLEASLGYSPIVNVEDEDHHIVRSMVSKGDCDGAALLWSLEGRYDITKNWFLTLGLDIKRIETDGKLLFVEGEYENHKIEQKIESNQVYTALTAGYAF